MVAATCLAAVAARCPAAVAGLICLVAAQPMRPVAVAVDAAVVATTDNGKAAVVAAAAIIVSGKVVVVAVVAAAKAVAGIIVNGKAAKVVKAVKAVATIASGKVVAVLVVAVAVVEMIVDRVATSAVMDLLRKGGASAVSRTTRSRSYRAAATTTTRSGRHACLLVRDVALCMFVQCCPACCRRACDRSPRST